VGVGKGKASQERTLPEARPTTTKEATVDIKRIPPSGAAFQTAHEKDTHPHACWDGWVFLGYTDQETDEEHSEVLPCRRCAEMLIAKGGET